MLSNVVWHFLKPKLKEYFRNLDEAALKISVLGGKVVLTNLQLRSDILSKQDIPLSIAGGFVEKLVLSFSITAPLTNVIRAVLEGVTLLVTLEDEKEITPEEVAAKEKEAKLRLLEKLNNDLGGGSEKTAASDDLFSSKSIFCVVNNLQVEVKNIHIRYEDSGKHTHCEPFAAGVVLEHFSISSADMQWRSSTQNLSNTIARKILALNGLGVYLQLEDSEHPLLSKQQPSSAKLHAILKSMAVAQAFESLDSILQPLSFNANLAINKKIQRQDGTHPPQFQLDLKLPHLALDLSQVQFANSLRTSSHLTHKHLRQKHSPGRPKVPIKQNPRAWWRFAAQSLTKRFREVRKAFQWETIRDRRDNRVQYISLYSAKLQGKSLSKEHSKQLKILEEDVLSIKDIELYRTMAKARVPKPKAKPATLVSSFTSWWYGSSQPPESQIKDDIKEIEESEKLLRDILAHEDDYEEPKDADYVGAVVHLSIDEACFTLHSEKIHDALPALQLKTTTAFARVLKRPVSDGIDMLFSLGETTCQTYSPETQQLFPMLRTSQLQRPSLKLKNESSRSFESPLNIHTPSSIGFEVLLSTNPLQTPEQKATNRPRVDTAVAVVVHKHVVEVQPKALSMITSILEAPKDEDAAAVAYLAVASYDLARRQMKAGLIYALEERKTVDVSISLHAPILSIHTPAHQPNGLSDHVVVDLGTLSVVSNLAQDLPADATTLSVSELELLAYDAYDIAIEGMQAKVLSFDATADGSVHDAALATVQEECSKPSSFLQKTSLALTFQKCIQANSVNLPEMKLAAQFPSLNIRASDDQLLRLTRVGQAFEGAFAASASDKDAASRQAAYDWYVAEYQESITGPGEAIHQYIQGPSPLSAMKPAATLRELKENATISGEKPFDENDIDDVDDEIDDDGNGYKNKSSSSSPNKGADIGEVADRDDDNDADDAEDDDDDDDDDDNDDDFETPPSTPIPGTESSFALSRQSSTLRGAKQEPNKPLAEAMHEKEEKRKFAAQLQKIHISAKVEHVAVSLCEVTAEGEKVAIASVELFCLQTTVVNKTFNTDISASLGGIAVSTELLRRDDASSARSAPTYVLFTHAKVTDTAKAPTAAAIHRALSNHEKGGQFVEVDIALCGKSHPLFYEQFNATCQNINVRLSKIAVHLDHHTLLVLIKRGLPFFSTFAEAMQELSGGSSTDVALSTKRHGENPQHLDTSASTMTETLSALMSSSSESDEQTARSSPSRTSGGSAQKLVVDTDASLHFRGVEVIVSKNTTNLFVFSLRDLSVDLRVAKEKTEASVSLQSIYLQDFSVKDSLYPIILRATIPPGSESFSHLLAIDVTVNNNTAQLADTKQRQQQQTPAPLVANVRMASLQLVVVGQFLSNIASFAAPIVDQLHHTLDTLGPHSSSRSRSLQQPQSQPLPQDAALTATGSSNTANSTADSAAKAPPSKQPAQPKAPSYPDLFHEVNILINAPVVLIPKHPTQPGALAINLGRIAVSNNVLAVADRSTTLSAAPCHALFGHYLISLRDIQIGRTNAVPNTILSQNAAVQDHIERVIVSLSECTLQLLMKTANCNSAADARAKAMIFDPASVPSHVVVASAERGSGDRPRSMSPCYEFVDPYVCVDITADVDLRAFDVNIGQTDVVFTMDLIHRMTKVGNELAAISHRASNAPSTAVSSSTNNTLEVAALSMGQELASPSVAALDRYNTDAMEPCDLAASGETSFQASIKWNALNISAFLDEGLQASRETADAQRHSHGVALAMHEVSAHNSTRGMMVKPLLPYSSLQSVKFAELELSTLSAFVATFATNQPIELSATASLDRVLIKDTSTMEAAAAPAVTPTHMTSASGPSSAHTWKNHFPVVLDLCSQSDANNDEEAADDDHDVLSSTEASTGAPFAKKFSATYRTERNTVLVKADPSCAMHADPPQSLTEYFASLAPYLSRQGVSAVLSIFEQVNPLPGPVPCVIEFQTSGDAVSGLQHLQALVADDSSPLVAATLGPSMQTITVAELPLCLVQVSPHFVGNVLRFMTAFEDRELAPEAGHPHPSAHLTSTTALPDTPLSRFSSLALKSEPSSIACEESAASVDDVDDDDDNDIDDELPDTPSSGDPKSSERLASNALSAASTSRNDDSSAGSGDEALASFVYVRNLLGESDCVVLLPSASKDLSITATAANPTIIVVEDVSDPNSHNLLLGCSIRFRAIARGGTSVFSTNLDAITLISREGTRASTNYEVLSPASVNFTFQQSLSTVVVGLNCPDPLTVNVTYADVLSLSRILKKLEPFIGSDKDISSSRRATATDTSENTTSNGSDADAPAWTQRVAPIPFGQLHDAATHHTAVASGPKKGGATVALATPVEETCTLHEVNLNIYFINTKHGMRSPLLCVSMGVEGTISNWSREMNGGAKLSMAISSFEPKHASWEPILLGDAESSTGRPSPFQLSLEISSAQAHEFDLQQVSIVKSSANRNRTSADGWKGTNVESILRTETSDFWYCTKQRRHYVIFDLKKIAQLQRFFYCTKASNPPRQPRVSKLFSSSSPDGPWDHVCDIETTAITKKDTDRVYSKKFRSWARYWKWEIHSRMSANGAWVVRVGFETMADGQVIALAAKDHMDVTITSNGIQRLSAVAMEWVKDIEAPLKVAERSDQLIHTVDGAQHIATHRLVNHTGQKLAFTPIGEYDAEVASHFIVPTGSSFVFEPTSELLAEYDDPEQQHFTSFVRQSIRPIRDITVINVSKKQAPPPGFQVINRNLNEGTNGDEIYLCVSWKGTKRPITDVVVSYVGTNGCRNNRIGIHDPVPSKYELIDMNLNSGCSSSLLKGSNPRDVYISIYRGNGAPLLDVIVAFIDILAQERIPSGYNVLKKDLSRGCLGLHISPYLCVKRAACRWKHQAVATVTKEPPITDLRLVQLPERSKQDPQPPPGDDWDGRYGGKFLNLNKKSGGPRTFLFKCTSPSKAPITAIAIEKQAEPRNELWESTRIDVNAENGCSEIFIHFCREPGARPIVDIVFVSKNNCPPDYQVLPDEMNKHLPLSRIPLGESVLFLCYRTADPAPGQIEIVGAQERTDSASPNSSLPLLSVTGSVPNASSSNTAPSFGNAFVGVSADGSEDDVSSVGDDDSSEGDGAFGNSTSSNEQTAGVGMSARKRLARTLSDSTTSSFGTSSLRATSTLSRIRSQRKSPLHAVSLLADTVRTVHTISLEVNKYLPIGRIPINAVGEMTYILTPSTAKDAALSQAKTAAIHPTVVVVEVYVKDSIKFVVVRSSLAFRNLLRVPVDLGVFLSISKPCFEQTVQPGEVVVPPIGSMDALSVDDKFLPLMKFFNPLTKTHFYATSLLAAANESPRLLLVGVLGYLFKTAPTDQRTDALYVTRCQHISQFVFVNREGTQLPHFTSQGAKLSQEELDSLDAQVLGYVPCDNANTDAYDVVTAFFASKNPSDLFLSVHQPTQPVTPKFRSYSPLARGRPWFTLVRSKGLVRVKPHAEHGAYSSIEQRQLYPAADILRWRRNQSALRASVADLVSAGGDARTYSLSSAARRVSTSLELAAPVQITNGLPCTVVFGLCPSSRDDALPTSYFALAENETSEFSRTLSASQINVRVALVPAATSIGIDPVDVDDKPHHIAPGDWSPVCSISLVTRKADEIISTTLALSQPGSSDPLMLSLRFQLQQKFGAFGPMTLFFHSPCQIVNRTSMRLTMPCRDTANALYETDAVHDDPFHKPGYTGSLKNTDASPETALPRIGIFSHPTASLKACFNINGCVSSEVDLAKLPQSSVLECYEPRQKQQRDDATRQSYAIVVRWVLVGDEKLTKRFFVDPILTFNNNTGRDLILYKAEASANAPKMKLSVPAGGSLYSFFSEAEKATVWRLADAARPTSFSSSFSPTALSYEKKIIKTIKINDHSHFLPLKLTFMSFQLRNIVTIDESRTPPIRIENFSRCPISFRQHRDKGAALLDEVFVRSKHMMDYCYDDTSPTASPSLDMKAVDMNEMQNSGEFIEIDIVPEDIITLPLPLKFGNGSLCVNVVEDEATGTRRFIIGDSREQLRRIFCLPEAVPLDQTELSVNVALAGVFISVLQPPTAADTTPAEFLNLSLQIIEASYTKTSLTTGTSISILDVQLDHQKFDAEHETIIFNAAKLGDNPRVEPVLLFSMAQRHGQIAHGRASDHVPYIGVRILPLSVTVDGDFLASFLRLLSLLDLLPDGSNDVPPSSAPWPTHFGKVFLSPLKLSITLSNISPILQQFNGLLRTFGVTLGNLNEAPLGLKSIELDNLLVTSAGLSNSITVEITKTVLDWCLKHGFVSLVFSLDILGNPLDALGNVAGGFKSLFYDPFEAVLVGPAEFGALVSKGAQDLGKSVVGAGFGVGKKMTSAVAKGIATATMDDRYQESRDKELRAKPKNITEGFTSGLKMFTKGVASGITGIVTTPIQEGKKGGFMGGIKGVGLGVAGVVFKPLGGAFDMMSQTFAGTHAQIYGLREIRRIRLPRHISPFGLVVPYSQAAARGISDIRTLRDVEPLVAASPYILHVVQREPDGSRTVFYFFTATIFVTRVVKGKDSTTIHIKSKFSTDRIAGFRRRSTSARPSIELIFSDGSATVLKVAHETKYPQILRALRLIIDLHHAKTIQAKTDMTVFQPNEVQVHVVQVYEYERFNGGRWQKAFFPTDPFDAFQNKETMETYDALSEIPSKEAWQWVSAWKMYNLSGSDGWEYSPGVGKPFSLKDTDAQIRRRLWKRKEQGFTNSDS